MLTGKERSLVKAAANGIPTIMLGKGGLTPTVIDSIIEYLTTHEVAKISVLKNADAEARSYMNDICTAVGAEPVTVIGNKIIIYKKSNKNVTHIIISNK